MKKGEGYGGYQMFFMVVVLVVVCMLSGQVTLVMMSCEGERGQTHFHFAFDR